MQSLGVLSQSTSQAAQNRAQIQGRKGLKFFLLDTQDAERQIRPQLSPKNSASAVQARIDTPILMPAKRQVE